MTGDEEVKDQAAGKQPGDFPDGAGEATADVVQYDSRIDSVELKLQKLVDGLAKHGIKIAL